MIFVTVGSALKGVEFTRLITKMDEIAATIDEEVVMQIGSVPYEPRHASFFRYCSYEESLAWFEKASLIVGHCGIGTILNAMKFGLPAIVVPRRISHGELHWDDHQVEIARRLEGTPRIHVAHEIEDLEAMVRTVVREERVSPDKPSYPERDKLVECLRSFLGSCV